ncbi:MAG: hypothetical protein ACRDRT_08220, partial [Pseudonocardiaceae bacterium]
MVTTNSGPEHQRIIIDRRSEATSQDGRATASNQIRVTQDEPPKGSGSGPVVVNSSGTAEANTGA